MTIINLQISETDTINNKNQTTGIQVERIMQNMMRKCKASRDIYNPNLTSKFIYLLYRVLKKLYINRNHIEWRSWNNQAIYCHRIQEWLFMLKFIIASIIPARETGHGWGILIEHGLYTPILIFNFLCRCVNFHNKNPGAGKPYKTPLLN